MPTVTGERGKTNGVGGLGEPIEGPLDGWRFFLPRDDLRRQMSVCVPKGRQAHAWYLPQCKAQPGTDREIGGMCKRPLQCIRPAPEGRSSCSLHGTGTTSVNQPAPREAATGKDKYKEIS